MAQPRESNFHQSSPESSKGGGDSYKHEGTPETRLTAFSPEEASARSSKPAKLSTLRSSESQPISFTTKNRPQFGSIASLQLEKDPFVSSTTSKSDQKLSPTASAFRPFSNQLAPRGSTDTATPFEGGVESNIETNIHQRANVISSKPSTYQQLSRCIEISSASQIVTVNDVEAYLLVSLFPVSSRANAYIAVETGRTGRPLPGKLRDVFQEPSRLHSLQQHPRCLYST